MGRLEEEPVWNVQEQQGASCCWSCEGKMKKGDIKGKDRETGKCQIMQRLLGHLCLIELAAVIKMFHTFYCPKQ